MAKGIRTMRLAAACFCILASSAATPPPTSSAPVFLLCSFAKGPAALSVTADEANGLVTTFVQSTGYMQKRAAAFSPSAVEWSSGGALNTSYRLSRVDLSIHRTLDLGMGTASADDGSCKLQEVPKRAF